MSHDAGHPRGVCNAGYIGQNLLAQSPYGRAYDHNPGFQRFISDTDFHSPALVETEAVEFERQLRMRLNSAWQRSFPTLRYSSAEGRQGDALTCLTLLEVIEE